MYNACVTEGWVIAETLGKAVITANDHLSQFPRISGANSVILPFVKQGGVRRAVRVLCQISMGVWNTLEAGSTKWRLGYAGARSVLLLKLLE